MESIGTAFGRARVERGLGDFSCVTACYLRICFPTAGLGLQKPCWPHREFNAPNFCVLRRKSDAVSDSLTFDGMFRPSEKAREAAFRS